MDYEPEAFACHLSASQLGDQRDAWKAMEALRVDGTATDEGFRIRFRREGGRAEVLRDLVDVERKCCGWARWTVKDEDNYLVLEVSGPSGPVNALARVFGVDRPSG